MRIILWIRAKLSYLWRIGLISRGTAFRWEMDEALGEYSTKSGKKWRGGKQ